MFITVEQNLRIITGILLSVVAMSFIAGVAQGEYNSIYWGSWAVMVLGLVGVFRVRTVRDGLVAERRATLLEAEYGHDDR
jgi:hypothetical protein